MANLAKVSVSRENGAFFLAVRDMRGARQVATLTLTKRGTAALAALMQAAHDSDDPEFEGEFFLTGTVETTK